MNVQSNAEFAAALLGFNGRALTVNAARPMSSRNERGFKRY
jgi:hypothetical protein